jgi:hypothetical protein
MSFALEILLVVLGVAAAGYFIDRYVRARRDLRGTRTAYFSGGSLDGTTKPVHELPKTLTHGDEIYRRDSVGPKEGIYVYVGTVDDPHALSREI